MWATMLLAAAATATVWLVLARGPVPKLLLSWYVREVEKLDVPEDPYETIHTYPLA
jgi:hypothetical protein